MGTATSSTAPKASTSKSSKEEMDKYRVIKKDPLVSNLERRKKRKLGFVEDISSGKVYKKMREIPTTIPNHLSKCLEWHKTKPWLGKAVKYTLIAYPNIGENPPDNLRVFFSSAPFNGNNFEKNQIANNGKGYIWFIPSPFLWSAHCFVQHQKDSHIICDSNNLIRTFTDEGGNKQSFIFGVIFNDGTFKILDHNDYEKECRWWDQHTVASGGHGEKNMFLKSKSIYSTEGESARRIMRRKILAIFSAINNTPIKESDSLITEIENEFMNLIEKHGTTTIFDYVSHCLAILIFIKPESPLYKYTTSFRLRLVAGYYKNSAIPYLETFDMFPDFYTTSKSSQDIERIKQWVKSYHDQEINDFFSTLISDLDPTSNRPTKPRSETFDPIKELSPVEGENEIKMDKNLSENEKFLKIQFLRERAGIKKQCIDVDDDIPTEDIMIYKDKNGRIFCFTVDQLLDMDDGDDSNPLDPEGPKISQDFLYKFKKNFREDRERKKKKKKEDKCRQCEKSIKEYVLRTGSIIKSGKDLKGVVQDFCSVECLEEYKKMEELFGPQEDSKEDEHIKEIQDKFEDEKKDLEIKFQEQLKFLDLKLKTLQEKLTQAESTIKILNFGTSKAESDKILLEKSISEKEEILSDQRKLLQELQDEISQKTGKNISNLSNLSDIINLMDKKDLEKDRKAAEYEYLSEMIAVGQKETENARREVMRLQEQIEGNNSSIEKYEKLIDESRNIQSELKNQIEEKDNQYQEAFMNKSNEMKAAIAERDVMINSLKDEIRIFQKNGELENEKSIKDRQASIIEMNREIKIAKKDAEEKRKLLELSNANLADEKKRVEELVRIDHDIQKNFKTIISVKENEIEKLKNEKKELVKKLEGVPELQRQINEYRINGNDEKLQDTEAQLAIVQGKIDQNNLLQGKIEKLEHELIQTKADIEFCKSKGERENDTKRIDELSQRISQQDVLIKEKQSIIDNLESQQEKCRLNDNITEEMEKLKSDHHSIIAKKDAELLRRLDDQRESIMADMKTKYESINKSNMSDEKIRKQVSDLVDIEKKKIEDLYKDKIILKKEELDKLMTRADEAENKLKKIKPDHKKKIKEAQNSLDEKIKEVDKLLETIAILEKEKDKCKKESDVKKIDILHSMEDHKEHEILVSSKKEPIPIIFSNDEENGMDDVEQIIDDPNPLIVSEENHEQSDVVTSFSSENNKPVPIEKEGGEEEEKYSEHIESNLPDDKKEVINELSEDEDDDENEDKELMDRLLKMEDDLKNMIPKKKS